MIVEADGALHEDILGEGIEVIIGDFKDEPVENPVEK